MRALLHVVSFALMLPGLILASAFVLSGHAIAGGTLIEFFSRLPSHATWLVRGGLLAAGALFVAMLIAGFVARTRAIPRAGVASLGASGWLALKEWPWSARISNLGSISSSILSFAPLGVSLQPHLYSDEAHRRVHLPRVVCR